MVDTIFSRLGPPHQRCEHQPNDRTMYPHYYIKSDSLCQSKVLRHTFQAVGARFIFVFVQKQLLIWNKSQIFHFIGKLRGTEKIPQDLENMVNGKKPSIGPLRLHSSPLLQHQAQGCCKVVYFNLVALLFSVELLHLRGNLQFPADHTVSFNYLPMQYTSLVLPSANSSSWLKVLLDVRCWSREPFGKRNIACVLCRHNAESQFESVFTPFLR